MTSKFFCFFFLHFFAHAQVLAIICRPAGRVAPVDRHLTPVLSSPTLYLPACHRIIMATQAAKEPSGKAYTSFRLSMRCTNAEPSTWEVVRAGRPARGAADIIDTVGTVI